MEFNEKIKQLSERAKDLKDALETEEATKNALIMPFIQSLGYDVFNPKEVVPEFTADIGIKKGEKVDYAIFKDDKPIILVECKKVEDKKLDITKHASQLFRYFTASDAKFIILTNGLVYKFFSDIEADNKLDKEPFFTFNLLEFKDNQISTLQNFMKNNFDIEKATVNAGDLKYINRFEEVLEEEYKNPSADFVRYLIAKADIIEGRITPSVIEKHTKTTIEAFNLFMSKTMKTALENKMTPASTPLINESLEKEKAQPVTTIEELEGFAIVKSILNGFTDLSRLYYRDTINYFNIILDDNIKKTICRLYLNGNTKYIAFMENKAEEKNVIVSIDDLFKFSDTIRAKTSSIDAEYAKK
jgi:hypothetical protein